MEEPVQSKFLSQLRQLPFKALLAEVLATFLLTVIGDAVVAVNTLRRLEGTSVIVGAFGWGLAVMIAITAAGEVSGGHGNPAVTLAFATIKKFKWKHVLPYMAAQYLGAFLAAAVVYLVYYDAIQDFDGGTRMLPPHDNSTAQIFACYPQPFASTLTCFWDQVVGTGLLLIMASAVTDKRNVNLPNHAHPLMIGLGLAGIIFGFGYNCMAPLNPARDLSPRIFTAMASYGSDAFKFRNYNWFWVPIIGPHIGAIVGVWIYKLFVELHHESKPEYKDVENGKDSFTNHAFSKDFEANLQKEESLRNAIPVSPTS